MLKLDASVNAVADRIAVLLKEGIELNPAVRDYVDSIAGDVAIGSWPDLLKQDNDAFGGSLQDLLFFPDATFQEQLEDSLQKARLVMSDEPALIAAIKWQVVGVPFFLPDQRHPHTPVFTLPVALDTISVLITRLKVWKNLPNALETALAGCLSPEQLRRYGVLLRNAHFLWNNVLIDYFTKYFQRIDPDGMDFDRTLKMTLAVVDEHSGATDLQAVFTQKKAALLRMLHQYEIFETSRLKRNMEIMMLQRAHAPAIDAAAVRARIAAIDAVCLQLWETSDATP